MSRRYTLLDCKTYTYRVFSNHVDYVKALQADYEYCKSIEHDDYVGKLEGSVTQLPYYHPHWLHVIVENDKKEAEKRENQVSSLERLFMPVVVRRVLRAATH